jgi:hypothetical protein
MASAAVTVQQVSSGAMGGGQVLLPGTNFTISSAYLRFTLTVQQPTLAAGDFLVLIHNPESIQFRELQNDVHSLQVLVRSSVAGLKFGLALRDPGVAQSLTKLCTIPTADTWTLITCPNLPIWPNAGNFTSSIGNLGYYLILTLASGTTFMAPTNDTWQSGNFFGATGQSNFASQAAGATFDLAFVQHEPGAQCSTPIDKPFTQNLEECLRYFQKSYSYGVKPGTVDNSGRILGFVYGSGYPWWYTPFKKIMAKVPTIAGYSPATGALNTVRDESANVDRSITSSIQSGDAGFSGFTLSSFSVNPSYHSYHYLADTGW